MEAAEQRYRNSVIARPGNSGRKAMAEALNQVGKEQSKGRLAGKFQRSSGRGAVASSSGQIHARDKGRRTDGICLPNIYPRFLWVSDIDDKS